jgi:hypothetical protein
MTRVNNYPLLIEFVPGTRISREPEVVSKLPIVQNTGSAKIQLAWPIVAESQPTRVARVGYLGSSRSAAFSRTDPFDAVLLQGLREQGYAEGQKR